jgi:hypothetical protein
LQIATVLVILPTPVHARSGAVRTVRTDVAWLMTDRAQLLANVHSPLLITHRSRDCPEPLPELPLPVLLGDMFLRLQPSSQQLVQGKAPFFSNLVFMVGH